MAANHQRKFQERRPWPTLDDARWRTDLSAVAQLPPFSEVWLRMHGSPTPVRWTQPLTLGQVEAMNVFAWAQSLVTDSLSRREFEIFLTYARGIQQAETAAKLHKSPKTISVYYKRMREKTGLRNHAEIIVYAYRHGLVKWGALPDPAHVALTSPGIAAKPPSGGASLPTRASGASVFSSGVA